MVEGTVTIKRPVEEVFKFYRNFKNLPSFLGDVIAIKETGPGTYRWTIQGPLRIQADWTIRVTKERINELMCYETESPPALKTFWEIHFASGSKPGETEVHEVMKTPLGRFGSAALALIGKSPAREVLSNLRRSKEVMETGRAIDASYAIKGKFDLRPSS